MNKETLFPLKKDCFQTKKEADYVFKQISPGWMWNYYVCVYIDNSMNKVTSSERNIISEGKKKVLSIENPRLTVFGAFNMLL